MRRTEPAHQAASAARLICLVAALAFCLGAAIGCAPNRRPPIDTTAHPPTGDDPAATALAPGSAAASRSVPDLPAPRARPRLGLPATGAPSGSGRAAAGEPASGRQRNGDAASLAAGYVGTPYVFGGSTPRGFDCSGLVQYVYRKCGVKLPRRAIDQSRRGNRVSARELRRNDLVFFRTRGSSVSHVGIYVGSGEFIHAPGTGKSVRTDSLDNPWWRKRLVVARRVL